MQLYALALTHSQTHFLFSFLSGPARDSRLSRTLLALRSSELSCPGFPAFQATKSPERHRRRILFAAHERRMRE
jgi:hypothetical protein